MEGFKFKKKFGQNFLKNKKLLNDMIKDINLTKEDLVIEIGPGDGALTEELIKYSRVIAYEIDTDLESVLINKFNTEDFKVIFDDFLKRNIKSDIENIKYNNLYVISNVPYYITTPIIIKIIEDELDVEEIVIMVQKELGERFSSKQGSREYSSITVLLNYYFNIRKKFLVSRNNFYPVPNVDSIVISLKKKKKNKLKDKNIFLKLIRDSFQYKRKTLKNNLSNYDLRVIEKVLKKHNYDLNVRAENLDCEVFVEMANALSK